MNKFLAILPYFFLLFAATLSPSHLDEKESPRIDPCEVYGKVFFVDDARRADVVVYIDQSEAFADLKVFMADNVSYADDFGLWYATKIESQANFKVHITKKKNQADFSIFYVEDESYASCK